VVRRSQRGRRWLALLFLITLAGLLPACTAQARPLDARKYGMVGNNTKDNSAALLRACMAGVRTGRPVVIPKGRYYLASPVVLPAGVKLRGSGGYEQTSTSAAFKGTWLRGAVRFNSNVSVSDMKIGDRLSDFTVAPAGTTGSRTSNVRFTRVRFRGGGGGGYGGAIFAVDARSVDGLSLHDCRFECNLGEWNANAASGALAFAVDTSIGNVIRNVSITNSVFGVTNGVRNGQPTFNIVFWQSEESGSGWWGDITIANNTFETTDEMNLDFDGLLLRDNGHNDVVIRGNLIKGGGKARPDGSSPPWGYTICTEPTREGTIIEGNRLYQGYFNVFKTTKETTDTIFRNNVIDLTVANGVTPYYEDFYRTVNLFEGARNQVTGNTIVVPKGAAVDSEVIYSAEPTSTVSGNEVVRK
jgi:hypothetical protein